MDDNDDKKPPAQPGGCKDPKIQDSTSTEDSEEGSEESSESSSSSSSSQQVLWVAATKKVGGKSTGVSGGKATGVATLPTRRVSRKTAGSQTKRVASKTTGQHPPDPTLKRVKLTASHPRHVHHMRLLAESQEQQRIQLVRSRGQMYRQQQADNEWRFSEEKQEQEQADRDHAEEQDEERLERRKRRRKEE